MDEAKQIIESLRYVQSRVFYGDELLDAEERIEAAIALIERLRPREMSDDEVCKLLNEIAYDGADDWTPDGDGLGYIRSGSLKQGMGTWTAHAIAEKLLRGKEASTG